MTKTTDERENVDDLATVRRKRATRVDVHIAHEALKVARPTNVQIGPWQQRAAWLLALAERRHSRGRCDDGIAAEARALLDSVESRRAVLQQSVDSLPDNVAGSSRLDDTAKALDSVAQVLQRTIDLATRSAAG